jgi:tetratricopeptide (TPR) repeat protein
MQRKLYIILISLIFSYLSFSQNIHLVKSYADEQFRQGNFESALKNYQRVILFDTEKVYNNVFYQIASIHYILSDFDNAVKYYDFAYNVESNDSIKFELILKKALCNLKQENYLAALYELLDLPDDSSPVLSSKKYLYSGICYFGLEDQPNSIFNLSHIIDSTGIIQLNETFRRYENFKKKYRPEKVEWMSKLLPGSGQMFVGETASGINSFLLLSTVTYFAIQTSINYSFLDGILVLSSWFYRYYSGGYTHANTMAGEKISNEKMKVYKEILEIVEKNYTNN